MWQIAENIDYICKKKIFAMLVAFTILAAISLIILVVAIVIMMGRGDDFIVGYNIASTKSRDMYRIKRVRMIVGILLLLIAIALPVLSILLIMGYKEIVMTVFPPLAFVLIAGTFTASHLWAKKKDNKK
jgi:hypothetical protein